MILKQVEIFEFKSIKHLIVHINDIICLVGKNECGKTNILQAISFLNFYDNQFKDIHTLKTSKRYRKGFPMVSGLFELENSDKEFFGSYNFKDSGVFFQMEMPNFDNIYMEIKRWGNNYSDIDIRLINKENFKIIFEPIDNLKSNNSEVNKFIESFFNDIYPSINLFTDEDFQIEPASTSDLLGSAIKFESFRRLLYVGGVSDLNKLNQDIAEVTELTSEVEENLNQLFSKYYLQDKSIKILLRESQGKWNVLIQDSTKKSYNLTERSPGFQYFFAFIINKHFLNSNSNKNNIFLLDEPGKSLHPNGSRDLLKTFKDISEKCQIIYTTHNAFLALRDNIDNLQLVTKNSKDGTTINVKPYRNKYEALRKELGILLNDSFILSDLNLLVEGATEKYALHYFFSEFQKNELEWVNILNCESFSEIKPSIKYINSLSFFGIVLLDSDDAGQKLKNDEKFKQLTKNTDQWQVIEINDIFADKNTKRTFEDLFPSKLYIKAYNNFYTDNKETIDFDIKEFEPLNENKKIKSPIVNEVTNHFHLYSSSTINKVAIMRICISLISLEKDKENLYSNIEKLVELISNKIKNILK